MAFTADQFQGIYGEFKPVIDPTGTPTADQFQGIYGKFDFVLDELQGGGGGGGQPIGGAGNAHAAALAMRLI